jgi:hypothetical protein
LPSHLKGCKATAVVSRDYVYLFYFIYFLFYLFFICYYCGIITYDFFLFVLISSALQGVMKSPSWRKERSSRRISPMKMMMMMMTMMVSYICACVCVCECIYQRMFRKGSDKELISCTIFLAFHRRWLCDIHVSIRDDWACASGESMA